MRALPDGFPAPEKSDPELVGRALGRAADAWMRGASIDAIELVRALVMQLTSDLSHGKKTVPRARVEALTRAADHLTAVHEATARPPETMEIQSADLQSTMTSAAPSAKVERAVVTTLSPPRRSLGETLAQDARAPADVKTKRESAPTRAPTPSVPFATTLPEGAPSPAGNALSHALSALDAAPLSDEPVLESIDAPDSAPALSVSEPSPSVVETLRRDDGAGSKE